MTKKIMFEVFEDKKKELFEYLKKNGFHNENVEKLEILFHKDGISFVKPVLKF